MNKKRQLLIDTALSLFYKKGINTIGINEILQVSGVAKNTLYNHFSSKEELILAALEQRHQLFMEWLTIKIRAVNTNKELIKCLFDALQSWFNNTDPVLGNFRGCFFINSSAEFSDKNGKISLFCQQHKEQIRHLIEQHLIEENPLLLDAICIMKEGAICAAYVSNDLTVTDKSITILNQLSTN